MKEIEIEIEDIKLAEMGIEQPIQYRPLRFMESKFVGYWISNTSMIVYIGSEKFICEKCQKNINILESIFNK
jgi:hypothetical protein